MTSTGVVTGIGAVSPLGGTAEETWESALAGTSGVKALDNDWQEKYLSLIHI